MSRPVIRLTYRIETAGDVAALAAKIASDQSTGTFVAVPGETPELKARVAAEVVGLRRLEPTTTPSFPEQNTSGKTVYARAEADIEFPLEAVGTDLGALTTIADRRRLFDQGLERYSHRRPAAAAGIRGRASGSSIRRRWVSER